MNKKSSGRRIRLLFNSEFKAKFAYAALRKDKTMAHLYQQYELHPSQINEWKKLLQARTSELLDSCKTEEPVNLAPPHAKIGQQTLELDFLNSALTKAGLLSAGK